jgi:uncharacterized protein (TIGR02246 family)
MRMNLRRRIALVICVVILSCGMAHAAPSTGGTPDQAAIRSVLDAQVQAWNRGDVATFMQGYRNSPETTFVGKTVEHGFSNILARYRKQFATKQQMGTLSFDGLEVRTLDAHYATVTGRFHLIRTKDAGGDASGIFSLIFEKTDTGWKIILDHTS